MSEEQKKKPLFIQTLELLFILTLLLSFVDLPWIYPDEFIWHQRLILPGIIFLVRILYGLNDIGIAIAASLTFLNSIGVNGLPAIALFLLVIVGIMNIFSADSLWANAFKIIGGFTTGSFAQKAVPKKR
ncbi:hypothetical protein C8N46_11445 [Kordia periserrulae]|uniref:Uncharacterized protein n=1 Tax=Kordia periserrulae TaxID=701523 RepID=A0A2T6BQM6_9FLAO|nr:hypothetical protein [Kordia periserrulae]PTX58400.1 hypothetical protein C8N46_11445 [Kordia periserrulae]